jgi:SAM-dependent methyltransferase
MREFWDDRAREDPYYYVDNRLAYGEPDLDVFWRGGEEVLDGVHARLGVEVTSDQDVVEIGCGVGRLTRALAGRAASVRALDVSGRMLAEARAQNPDLENVEWILGDGTSLAPIADASADVVHSYVVFQHIPDPEITLGYVREIGRVLRPGGWAAFQVSNDPTVHGPRGWREHARGAIGRLTGRRPRGQGHPAWLGSAIDLERLAEVARGAGMELERVDGAGTQHCLVLLRRT